MPRRNHPDFHKDVIPTAPARGEQVNRPELHFAIIDHEIFTWPHLNNPKDSSAKQNGLRNFDQSVLIAAEALRFVSPNGAPSRYAFITFAAMFTAANGWLWPQFKEVDPGSGGGGDEIPRVKLLIWHELETNLNRVKAAYAERDGVDYIPYSIVRASCSWLFGKLAEHLRVPNDLNDSHSFFTRFTSGQNCFAAKSKWDTTDLPKWELYGGGWFDPWDHEAEGISTEEAAIDYGHKFFFSPRRAMLRWPRPGRDSVVLNLDHIPI